MNIYMISISDNPKSQYYKNLVLQSWIQRGYTVEQFEASTPKTIKGLDDIPFKRAKKSGWLFTDTEKAVWYSHYRLWQKCVEMDEPIHIIEHDTWLFDYVPDFSNENIFLFSFYEKEFGSRHPGLLDTVAPCAGYYITPKVAQDLIDWPKYNTVNANVDWAVHDVFEDYHPATQRNIVLFQKYISPLVVARQVKHLDMGTTIVHNAIRV